MRMKIIGGPGGGYLTTPVLDHFREKGIGMSEQTKVVVPEGVVQAIVGALSKGTPVQHTARKAAEAFVQWQKEHPRVPTSVQWQALVHGAWMDDPAADMPSCKDLVVEWVRRMYDAPEPEVSTASKPKEVDDRLCPVCGIDRTKSWTTWAHSFVNGKLGCGHKEPPTVDPARSEVETFANVFMFGAILERPATTADEPVSEREKQQGIRENVTCVRAEDYSRLLAAYQGLLLNHQGKAADEGVDEGAEVLHSELEVPPEIADLVAGWAGSRLETCMNALAIAAWRRGKGLPDFESYKPVDF